MKKTLNINLNSFMFNIDEDAYNMLQIYLNKLEEHFSKLEEGREIVKDIEARVAEIFGTKINDNKQVINLDDVEEVILILGNVEDITGEPATNDQSEEKKSSEKGTSKKKSKKLYRDPDNKALGGVCSGLSEFSGVSITTIRIIFLVFLFIGQVSIIAYLILWIAVPEAKTTAQKLEMKGDKINVSNIEKTVKQEFEDLKKNFRGMKTNKFSDVISNIGKAILQVLTIFIKVFGKVLGVAFLIAGAVTIVSLTVGLLSVGETNLFFSNDFISMVWLPGILQYVTNTGTAWLLSISIMVVAVIPILVIIYWGVLLLFNIKSNKYLAIGTFSIWAIAIIMTAITALNIGASYKSIDQRTVKETILTDSTNVYNFELSPAYSDLKIMTENEIEGINDLHIFVNQYLLFEENNTIKSFPDIEFYTTEKENAEIQISYYARGANKAEAKENLKTVSYQYNTSDSITYLDPYFYVTSKKYRAQYIKVKIFIPEGSTANIGESLSPVIDIDDVSGRLEETELTNRDLLSTKNGFVVM